MYFLMSSYGDILLATLLGALLSLIFIALLLGALHLFGFRIPLRKARKKKTSLPKCSEDGIACAENEISEEELLVIISAAVASCAERDGRAFRVVSFRRI